MAGPIVRNTESIQDPIERQVVEEGLKQGDNWLTAIEKSIPVTVLSAYVVGMPVILAMDAGGTRTGLAWGVWGLCLVLAPLWGVMMNETGLSKPKLKWYQLWIFLPIAFLLWSFATLSPLEAMAPETLAEGEEAPHVTARVVTGVIGGIYSVLIVPLISWLIDGRNPGPAQKQIAAARRAGGGGSHIV